MLITRIKLENWRNFTSGEAKLREVAFVLGPNASGKSNFLDAFRFLRDVAKKSGGGLQKAVSDRGGLKKVRCLHARIKPYVRIEIDISEQADSKAPLWRYILEFNQEPRGHRRLLVKKEQVIKFDADGVGKNILNRPSLEDEKDTQRRTQTYLEQINTNEDFREISDYLNKITYVHLVPQLLKFSDQIGGRRLEDDPFGQGFLDRLAEAKEKTRTSRLKKIGEALTKIIPQIDNLEFIRDEKSGRPHLQIRYKHHRPRGAIQREDQFSDGTLRLISLFWLLLEGDALLLMEEPELSLNEEVVTQLPLVIEQLQRTTKRKKQIIISTHSKALLSNKGIDALRIVVLTPSNEGTKIGGVKQEELDAILAGLSVAEAVLPRAQKSSGPKSQLEFELL